MIGCQMTMDVFGFSKEDFIDGLEVGGAATFLEFVADSDIQLFCLKTVCDFIQTTVQGTIP